MRYYLSIIFGLVLFTLIGCTTKQHLSESKEINPFCPMTSFQYFIPEAGDVLLRIYDVEGKLIDSCIASHDKPGAYSVEPDLDRFDSGIYFYKMFLNGKEMETKKFVLLK
jgi:hypothetical protein